MSDPMLPTKAPPSMLRAWMRTFDRAWLLAGIHILLVAATFGLFWPTSLSLMERWAPSSSTAYGHGYAILAISLWLLIRNRHRWQDLTPRPSVIGAILLIPIALAWLVMLRAAIESGHQVLFPIFIWLAVCAALGPAIALRSLVPIGYLYFGLPVWDEINPLLQSVTTASADALLGLTGVHAYVADNIVHLAAGTFEIAGGCSGLHFLIVALALATLLGEINHDTPKVRAQLLALAAVLAVLTNWIRVYIIILAGYLTDMQHYLVRVEHYRFGWVVFAVMMTVFFLIVRRLPVSEPVVMDATQGDEQTRPLALMKGLAIALAALALVPALNLLAPVTAASPPPVAALLPRNLTNWSGPLVTVDASWKPVFVGADLATLGEYTSAGRHVSLYTALYLSQSQKRELLGYGNSIGGEDVHVLSAERRDARVPMTEVVTEKGAQQAVIRYFYQIDEAATNRAAVAALTYGLRSLTGSPAASVVAARAECVPDCDTARAALDDLMSAIELPRPVFSAVRHGDAS